MKKINWTVRVKNRAWWVALIPAVLILVQVVARVFGYEINLTGLADKLVDVVNAVFVVLALFGIVIDPTTKGVSDSAQALEYDKPREEEE